ncbi:MAG: cupin [Candidatus Staskawiczbacteria bacterium RIFCSPHIGHO2_02_FULL_34_9]|uniref:Cupin n=1 Tax=Candidatus Staskawiczbacteria bacterium RIFCSPHIGHO2_02_FULL_34_9 TaxID=1802206 RepID=A0A1G2HZ35_9BACT|nr:MAG: cupin [Candidatus Staskawiczbacteria bacterium RIFCSPHIGHO2_02_FULL_34_9]
MKGYVSNIEKETLENDNFRKVLYTDKNSQLVLMSLEPNEEIGEEVHEVDQFLRIEQGNGKAILDGIENEVGDGFAILVPAGARHNIVNGSEGKMKLYTIYSPPEHKKDTLHKTKEDATNDLEDHFDGILTE